MFKLKEGITYYPFGQTCKGFTSESGLSQGTLDALAEGASPEDLEMYFEVTEPTLEEVEIKENKKLKNK